MWRFGSLCIFFFFLFFLLLSLPLLCSAFYRARELAKNSPCYSPAFTGLLINPRAGSWAKDVVHDRIELLQFSLLNRLSPREMKGIMNRSSKRHRCVLGNDYFSLWSLNVWYLLIRSLIPLIK
jgi:hypothetical protein